MYLTPFLPRPSSLAMLTYRTFRNTDPPALAAIWQSRAGQPGLAQPVSMELLEELVYAKLYFDYAGLVVACQDGRPVGFAHAGFGPNQAGDGLATEVGATCVVLVRPDCETAVIAAGLLDQCEAYLQSRGAKTLYGGAWGELNPFYLGLYGGTQLPGVLQTDLVAHELYAARGYQEINRVPILQRELSNFEAPIDRRQMEIRRSMIVEMTADPPARTWWEASTLGPFDLNRFELRPRSGGPAAAWAVLRNMEPGGTVGVSRAAGLTELRVEEPFRRRGLAVFLLSEVCRQYARQSYTLVEVQTTQDSLPALGVFRKLSFRQVAQGSVFRRDL